MYDEMIADCVLKCTAEHYGVPVDAIVSRSRMRDWVYPRQVAIYALHRHFEFSMPSAAMAVRRLDHTTALHAIRQVDKDKGRKDDAKAIAVAARARIKNTVGRTVRPPYGDLTADIIHLAAAGLSPQEVADRLNISRESVSTTMYRWRQQLGDIHIGRQALDMFKGHAAARGMSVPQFLAKLLRIIADDQMADSILDDGVKSPSTPPRRRPGRPKKSNVEQEAITT